MLCSALPRRLHCLRRPTGFLPIFCVSQPRPFFRSSYPTLLYSASFSPFLLPLILLLLWFGTSQLIRSTLVATSTSGAPVHSRIHKPTLVPVFQAAPLFALLPAVRQPQASAEGPHGCCAFSHTPQSCCAPLPPPSPSVFPIRNRLERLLARPEQGHTVKPPNPCRFAPGRASLTDAPFRLSASLAVRLTSRAFASRNPTFLQPFPLFLFRSCPRGFAQPLKLSPTIRPSLAWDPSLLHIRRFDSCAAVQARSEAFSLSYLNLQASHGSTELLNCPAQIKAGAPIGTWCLAARNVTGRANSSTRKHRHSLTHSTVPPGSSKRSAAGLPQVRVAVRLCAQRHQVRRSGFSGPPTADGPAGCLKTRLCVYPPGRQGQGLGRSPPPPGIQREITAARLSPLIRSGALIRNSLPLATPCCMRSTPPSSWNPEANTRSAVQPPDPPAHIPRVLREAWPRSSLHCLGRTPTALSQRHPASWPSPPPWPSRRPFRPSRPRSLRRPSPPRAHLRLG